MGIKIVGSMESDSLNPSDFAGSLMRCLDFLASEANQAGFNLTAQALLEQEKVLSKELDTLEVVSKFVDNKASNAGP